jgi:hypothetical protein
MTLAGLFVDNSAVAAHLDGLTALTLIGCDELDATLAVPMAVPIRKRRDPLTGLVLAGKWLSRVVRPVFRCAEQGIGVGVVVGHSWSGSRPEQSQFSSRLCSVAAHNSSRSLRLGNAVVGVEDQLLLTAPTDSLAQARPAHPIGCNGGVFSFSDIPGHHLAAPDVDHQLEGQPDAAHDSGQIGDVPAAHLIWTSSPEPWHWARFLWWPGTPPPVNLAVGIENSIKAAL